MSTPTFSYISKHAPVREDRRFVRGDGTYVADIARPGTLHVAIVPSGVPAGRLISIDVSEAEKASGVVAVITGNELAEATDPLRQYLDVPEVAWRPLAHRYIRYAGEWVAAVVAESRALAEDAAELVAVDIEPGRAVVDAEQAMHPDAPLVHPEAGSNIAYQRTFTWGDVDDDFAAADGTVSLRVHWGRSSTVPLETFGVLTEWDEGRQILDVWASIQMPQYPEQIANALRIPLSSVRVHQDVDVGGSYGVKRGIKQSVLAGYLARRTGRPVRLIEDRIDNMRSGDAHGPQRVFDVAAAYMSDGVITSLKIRTIDDNGAYPGRSPLQLGKPVGALVGPYRIGSVEYEAIAVMTHKTGQVAVRGFGQAPTNYAIESAVEAVARALELDPVEVRRRNFIPPEAFPYEIPTGTTYDSGDYPAVLDKALDLADLYAMRAERDRIRAAGGIAGVGVVTCLEPSGGNAMFESLLNPKSQKTTFPEGMRLHVDGHGCVTATIAFTSAGQGHETMVATIVGEELGIDPELIRVVRADTQQGMPSQSPVASRMTIMLGGAIKIAAGKLKDKLIAIASHDLGIAAEALVYDVGRVHATDDEALGMSWDELVEVAHRQYHRMPEGMEPGLQVDAVSQVPGGGKLPTAEGFVHMYPCYAVSAHVVFVEIDPDTGKVTLRDWATVHDCGVSINPDVVHGMVLGGIAHGIGAALYEEFRFSEEGQPLSTTFVEYLLPSMAEIPTIRMAEHCTPSPFTSHGQKGIGEGGYMAAPAAVAIAIDDALEPFGAQVTRLPIRPLDLWTILHPQEASA